MKRKKEGKHQNNERWLLTYSDLITLLMIFFVIMYAISNVSSQKYQEITRSLNSVFGSGNNVLDEGDSAIPEDETNVMPDTAPELSQIEKLKEEVDAIIEQNKLTGEMSTKVEERGLVVSLVNNVFFDSAKANIRPEMADKLIDLTNVLNKIDNYIRIEGHTDNVPIHNREFNSNWELSSVRASNVVEYLISNGLKAEKLSAVGYGEYRPVADNNTDEGKSKNRRIDIVILDYKFNNSETQ